MSEQIDMEKRNVEECQRQNEALMPFKDGADFDFDNLVTLLISPKLTADLDDDTTIEIWSNKKPKIYLKKTIRMKNTVGSWEKKGTNTEYSARTTVMVDKLDQPVKLLGSCLPSKTIAANTERL